MASQLKEQFGASAPRAIAGMIRAVHADFPHDAFLRDALSGYGALSLTGRGFQIAEALHNHLPAEFRAAVDVLLASASQPHEHRASGGMAAFLYMPHLFFVARHGLDHFEDSMRAQHALTQLFTAEYSIRAFLEKHPEATLARLREWTADPSPHVRRLVSEGTPATIALGAASARLPERSAPGARTAGAAQGRSGTVRAALGGQQPQRHRQGSPGVADGGREALAARRHAGTALDRGSRTAFRGETCRRWRSRRARVMAARRK